MKPRNREINIFNLSMLDVISGAMAAFLMIMIVLLPFYKKEHIDYQAQIAALQQTLAAAQAAAEAARQAAATARAEAQRAQSATAAAEARATQAEAQVVEVTRQLHEAQAASQGAAERVRRAESAAQEQRNRADGLARELAKTFLVLYIRWNTKDDVDLHVIDPSGAEFSYAQRTIPSRAGELSEDTQNGPGAEVWEIRDAPPGRYQVFVELFSNKDPGNKPAAVQGRFFHRDGSAALPTINLNTAKQRAQIATLQIDAAGNVTMR